MNPFTEDFPVSFLKATNCSYLFKRSSNITGKVAEATSRFSKAQFGKSKPAALRLTLFKTSGNGELTRSITKNRTNPTNQK